MLKPALHIFVFAFDGTHPKPGENHIHSQVGYAGGAEQGVFVPEPG
jgi:hypothetical protein